MNPDPAAPPPPHAAARAPALRSMTHEGYGCMAHAEVLIALELWLEHPDCAQSRCHGQLVPPHGGSRVFRPQRR